MVVILKFDFSRARLGKLESTGDAPLLVLLGEVLDNGEHGLLVIIMVNDLDIIALDINQGDVRNSFSWLFWEVLDDSQSSLLVLFF